MKREYLIFDSTKDMDLLTKFYIEKITSSSLFIVSAVSQFFGDFTKAAVAQKNGSDINEIYGSDQYYKTLAFFAKYDTKFIQPSNNSLVEMLDEIKECLLYLKPDFILMDMAGLDDTNPKNELKENEIVYKQLTEADL